MSSVKNGNINFVLDSQSLHTSTCNASLDKDIQEMWDLETIAISTVDNGYNIFLTILDTQMKDTKLSYPGKLGKSPIPLITQLVFLD